MTRRPLDKTATTPYNKPSERSEKASKTSKSTSLMPNPSFSRRAFIGGGLITGALTFLGSIVSPGGTVINAYADEAGETHFSIYVLGRDEIPVMAMRKTESGNVPVAGVKVTITSLYNDKQVTVVTGDDGFAPAHIRDLSFQCDEDDAASYAFHGSATASCDGYRDVHFIKEYFESAVPPADDGTRPNVLEIPMEKDDGSSYLLNVSLDDIDILHSSVPMQVGDYNDIEHTVTVEVARTQGFSGDVEVSLIVDDTEWARATAAPDSSNPNVRKASFTDYFLSKISRGQKMRVRFAAAGEAAKTATLAVEFEQAIIFAQATDKLQCSPGMSLQETADRPDLFGMAWFFGESDGFSFGLPFFPLEVFSDASGNFGLSGTILSYQFYRSENGKTVDIPKDQRLKMAGGKWGWSGVDNWKQKTLDFALDNTEAAYADCTLDNDFLGSASFTRSLSINFDLSVMAYVKCEYIDKQTMRGDTKGSGFLGVCGKFGLDYSGGNQFAIGFMPMYFNFDITASLQVRFGAGLVFKNWLEDVSHDSWGSPLIIIICAQAGVSFGVGVRGVVGVGLRAYASFTSSISISQTNNPTVIYSIGAEIGFQIFIQALLFNKSFVITPPTKFGPTTNAGKSLAAVQNPITEAALSDLDLGDAQMVSQEALKEMSEFSSTPVETDEADAAALTAETGREPADGVLTNAPETFMRTRNQVLFSRSPLVASGPSHAQGFATPYGALSGNGDVLLGTSGTSDLAVTGTQADFRTVKTYNPRLGLVPVEQEILYDDVFSNAHVRTFVGPTDFNEDPEKNTVMARLVTVTIPGNAGETWTRTRVYVRLWDAQARAFGPEQVISFKLDGLEPKDRFDLDYDLDVVEIDGKVLLAMAVTSVKLEGDEKVAYDAAVDRQFLTFLVWNATDKCIVWSKSLYSTLTECNRSTHQPHVIIQGMETPDTYVACYYFQRRNVEIAQDEGVYAAGYYILDSSPFIVSPRAGVDAYMCKMVNAHPTGAGTFEVVCPDRTDMMETYANYSIVARSVIAQQATNGDVTITSAKFGHYGSNDTDTLKLTGVASIAPLGTQGGKNLFTYTFESDVPCEKKSRVISCNDKYKLADTETSGYTTDSNIFASADGKRLYTVRLSEGTNNKVDDETQALLDAGATLYSSNHYSAQTGANFGGASTSSDVREPVYQLLESRWIESLGAFHEFYPIARLSFAPDNTSILSCADGQRDFAMASLTGLPEIGDEDADLSKVKADIYHVAVPDVVAIQCEGVSVESPFAAAGDTVALHVDVSNTGNCLVNGFSVTILDGSGQVIEQNTYSDLRNYLQESLDNYHPVRDESGKPTYDEDGSMVSEFVEDIRDTSGILWPGFLRTYRFTFVMPEGYEGETGFTVQVSDPRSNPFANELTADAVAANMLAANGEPSMPDHLSWLSADDFAESLFGASLQTICDPRKFNFSVEQKAVSDAVASGFAAVPAVYQTDDEIDGGGYEPSDGDKGDGGFGSNGSGATTKRRGGTPQTGDSTMSVAGAAAAAAVAVGAAGAAMMANHAEKDDAE